MSRTTIKAGKINVDTVVRKIIGIPKDIPYAQIPGQKKHDYDNVANVFRRTSPFRSSSRGTGYKTGAGMKLIEAFVLSK